MNLRLRCRTDRWQDAKYEESFVARSYQKYLHPAHWTGAQSQTGTHCHLLVQRTLELGCCWETHRVVRKPRCRPNLVSQTQAMHPYRVVGIRTSGF